MPAGNLGTAKTIDTKSVYVRNNLMCFGEVRLQIANISSISDGKVSVKFPGAGIALCILGGLLLCAMGKMSEMLMVFGFVMIILGIGMAVFFLYLSNNPTSYLVITMNSGQSYQLTAANDSVLSKVLDVLEEIVMEGGVSGKNVTVSLDNASVKAGTFVINNIANI